MWMVGWGAVEISVIEKQEALTTWCPKPTGNSQEWEIERAEEIRRGSQGGTSLLHFCVGEAGWRHSSASEKTGRLLYLFLSFFLLLCLGLYAVVFQVGFIPSCGAGHVSGCQREPCDVNPPPPLTPTITQSPPAQRGGGLSSQSYLGIMWPQGKASVYLFIYSPIFMIYPVASFGDDLCSFTQQRNTSWILQERPPRWTQRMMQLRIQRSDQWPRKQTWLKSSILE